MFHLLIFLLPKVVIVINKHLSQMVNFIIFTKNFQFRAKNMIAFEL